MNKNITYRVAQFAIYELDNQSWVLQTTERINIIKNIKLVHFLKEIMYRRYIIADILLQLKENMKIFLMISLNISKRMKYYYR